MYLIKRNGDTIILAATLKHLVESVQNNFVLVFFRPSRPSNQTADIASVDEHIDSLGEFCSRQERG